MVEMLVFIIGVYTFVFGKLHLPWNLNLQGWRARIASLFLIAPFPLSILLGKLIGTGLSPDQGQSVFGLTEIILVAIGVGGAILFAWLTMPKGQRVEESSVDNP
jgi:hypothetical protein